MNIKKRLKIILILASISNVFYSCSTTNQNVNSFCDFYEPVFNYNSSCSVDITQEITQNNAIFYELCIEDK